MKVPKSVPEAKLSAPSVLIIGAGLAGACAARAVALAGWQVQLLDAAPAPAQGASALPVGLMAAKKDQSLPADDSAPNWDERGMACTRRWLEDLTQQGLLQRGLDWQACGSAHSMGGAKSGELSDNASHWQWQPQACWIKPQRLVAACLVQPGITTHWQAQVEYIAAAPGGWRVALADGRSLQAHALVLAASVDSARLLRSLPSAADGSPLRRLQDKHILKGSAGQAIYAPWLSEWSSLLPLPAHAPHACNGHGHFVPAVPWGDGDGREFWLSGATYVNQTQAQAAHTDADEAANLLRLNQLLPSMSSVLAQQKMQAQIQRFVGVRCTTPMCQPIVQALALGLWLCTGFGSRGLSNAPLAAEFLAQNLRSPLTAA